MLALAMGMDWQSIAWHWAIFGIVLVVGFALFSFGVMGGGDAKLAASTALWFGWEHVLDYVLLASILGAILTLMVVMFRAQTLPIRIGSIEWVERIHDTKSGVPYGIALGTAALMIYPTTLWMAHVFEAVTLR